MRNSLPLAIPIGATVIGPVFGISTFWVNDDVGNQMWLSGAETGSPEFRNPVLGPVFGLIISSLYRLLPGTAWYAFFLVLFPLGMLLLVLRQLAGSEDKSAFWGMLFVGTALLVISSNFVNYSFVSFFGSALAWVFLQYRVLREDAEIRRLIVPVLLCVIVLSIRSSSTPRGLIIPQAFFLACMVGILLLLPQIRIIGIRKILRMGIAICCVAVSSLLINVASVWTNDEWREFLAFYEIRGALNGVETVETYLRSSSQFDVYKETGLTRFSVEELSSFELYDAVNVTNEHLHRLKLEANKEQNFSTTSVEAFWLFLRQGLMELGASGALLGILSVLVLCAIKLSGRAFFRVSIGAFLSVFVIAVLIGFFSTFVRLPVYVSAGVTGLLIMQLLGLVSLANPRETLTPLRPLVSTSYLLLSIFSFSSWMFHHVNMEYLFEVSSRKQESRMWRDFYRSSSENDEVFLGGAGLAGYAFQTFPFDGGTSSEYRHSRVYEGGSNLRSPQSVKRWNLISGMEESVESLYTPDFYLRVVTSREKAIQIRDGLMASGRFASYGDSSCLEVVPSRTSDFYRLLRSECKSVSIIGTKNFDQSEILWTTREGSTFLLYPPGVGNFELDLVSPFGPYAEDHWVELLRFNRSGQVITKSNYLVQPASRMKLRIDSISRGDSILLRSLSKCVIPYAIQPELFPDRRELCVGVSGLWLDGREVPLEKAVVYP